MNNIIYPCLWFNGNAKEAATFYCSVFSNTQITSENPFVVTFDSAGQKFMCLNGGPQFTFNPSISFFVLLENEEELDNAWNALLEGGSVLMPLGKYDWSRKYGWLQDRFGLNWQLSFGKIQEVGQRFTLTLMFTGEQNGNAEKAVQFYTSVFDNSSVVGILRYGKDEGDKEGNVKHAQFKLGDTVFMAMDSSISHAFSFNEAISFVVDCKTQREIDYFWSKLSEGGSEGQCGWLKDRFGVSWQVVPTILGKLMSTPGKSERVMQAFMKMKKFDIAALEEA